MPEFRQRPAQPSLLPPPKAMPNLSLPQTSRPFSRPGSAPAATLFAPSSAPGNVAHHHHPYTPGYVRKRLQNLGVSKLPPVISQRTDILDATRRESIQPSPSSGPAGRPVQAVVVPARDISSGLVRERLSVLSDPRWGRSWERWRGRERMPGRYYWHRWNGNLDVCLYLDTFGYQWTGWYFGGRFFWTRWYFGRWWYYDAGLDRWCFWDDGWWWQDPYHVADLYYFDGMTYVPVDSSLDPVVTTQEPADTRIYRSPDGSRLVKVMGDTGDAFLYDTEVPPSLGPVYLASKVQGVKFSEPGQTPQILLTLSDGTVDLFDFDGHALNFRDTPPEEP
jgi:hypothetical protein